MADSESTTLILHLNLGDASKYEEDIFPREYYKAGNALSKGSMLLSSTLDEMIKIADIGIDLGEDPRFKDNMRAEFDRLTDDEDNLKNRPKSFNPLTVYRNYRAARLFHSASRLLFLETKRTSERIHREEGLIQAVPSKELSTINGQVSQNTTIGGLAVHLRGPLDNDTKQTVFAALKAIALRAKALNPFKDDPGVPQHSDDDSIITLADSDTASMVTLVNRDTPSSSLQQTVPMSPGSTYHFHFHNSVVATGSSVHGMTLNQGDGNRGSSMTEQSDP